ncbi:hypothetical protein SEMRO_1621_G286600.1 [Seminavis robusta]|uniref:Uncharacterized protein n=1 Tax=Seminavis robusta TaxID=568900 RepID=A0A9N8HTP1_9STRA|nr:hypothetical protein SEMRO_1621_G286600.1 [Seminavis robusta]|eukprot:Sro1621_g286600.1 n/a (189) ;mRNA; r:12360-12926
MPIEKLENLRWKVPHLGNPDSSIRTFAMTCYGTVFNGYRDMQDRVRTVCETDGMACTVPDLPTVPEFWQGILDGRKYLHKLLWTFKDSHKRDVRAGVTDWVVEVLMPITQFTKFKEAMDRKVEEGLQEKMASHGQTRLEDHFNRPQKKSPARTKKSPARTRSRRRSLLQSHRRSNSKRRGSQTQPPLP